MGGLRSMAKDYKWTMNVMVGRGSFAESITRKWTERPVGVEPAALAGGIPATPDHDLRFRGGKTIPQLSFANFYVGGSAAWNSTDVTNINNALSAIMSDRRLNNVIVQYYPAGTNISSNFIGSSFLPGPPPPVVSRGDIDALVNSAVTDQLLAGADLGSTVINLLLPEGTVLTTDEAPTGGARRSTASQAKRYTSPAPGRHALGRGEAAIRETASSTDGLGGYHGSIHKGPQTLYFAVGVFSKGNNGIDAFGVPWKNVVATFYHELCEARTDSDVEDANRNNDLSFIGWNSDQREECGDLPIFEDPGLNRVFQEIELASGGGSSPIQLQYSDAVHGPEGPIDNPDPPAPRS
jgi:hypothetical protein